MKASSILAFGSPRDLYSNAKAKDLLVKIISDGNFLHSCLDYQGSLQLTQAIALENSLPVKLICKTYLNYPVKSSLRRGSLCEQISQVKELFAGVKIELVPQISSIYAIPARGYASFIREIYLAFQIKQLLIEVFPETESKCFKFMDKLKAAALDLGLEDEISFGFTAYDNLSIQGFTRSTLVKAKEMNLTLAPMRILGSPASDKDVANAIRRLKDFHESNRLFRGITRVSAFNHYETLTSIVEKEFKEQVCCDPFDIECIAFRDDNRCLAADPYGLCNPRSKLVKLKSFVKDMLIVIGFCVGQKPLSAIRKLMPTNFI